MTKQPLSLIIEGDHLSSWKYIMSYNSWFQCVRGCDQRYSIYDVVYRCEQCGGLLDVEHDIEALKARLDEGIPVFEVDCAINDDDFAGAVMSAFRDMDARNRRGTP